MDQVMKALVRLSAAFPQANVPDSTLVLYQSELADLEPSLISATIEAAMTTARKFPSIAELRENYREDAQRRSLYRHEALPTGRVEPSVPMPETVKAKMVELGLRTDERAQEMEPS